MKGAPCFLETIAHPDQKQHRESRIKPVGEQTSKLRNKNIGDEAPYLAVPDLSHIEIDQTQVTRVNFVKNENERSERGDVPQQAWNSDKAKPPLQFIHPAHERGT